MIRMWFSRKLQTGWLEKLPNGKTIETYFCKEPPSDCNIEKLKQVLCNEIYQEIDYVSCQIKWVALPEEGYRDLDSETYRLYYIFNKKKFKQLSIKDVLNIYKKYNLVVTMISPCNISSIQLVIEYDENGKVINETINHVEGNDNII